MATQLQQAYDVIQKKLQPVTDQMYDKDKNKTVEKILAAAEEKTNIKREKLVYGVVAGLLIYFIIGALAQILSNIIGFAYPAYRSIKAVRSSIKEDDTQWLIYWIVFASFSIIDFSIFSTVPFYWMFKKKLQPVTDQMYDKDKNKTVEKILAAAEEKTNIKREKLIIFLLYLHLPVFNGATVIYHNFIDPACTFVESYFHPSEPKKTD
ncbi:M protein repeat protein [Ancylostoma caninum]|uniref:Receptor expression-enhancing protein n=1 Tax=Ancylostoma caninum TaxID=29170 RepID=A0A368GCY9_ANCCA|nr:M protein repeat protein [Ancylostoma caninum]